MRHTKILFTVSLVSGAVAALASGCGSSTKSNESSTNTDASGTVGEASEPSPDATAAGEAGALGAPCGSAFIGGGAYKCEQNLTCCIDPTNALTAITGGGSLGTCTAVSACTEPVSYECLAPSDCPTSASSCCNTPASPDAGDAASEAAPPAMGGFGGLAGAGLSLQATCQTSCTATQGQLCATAQDCTANPDNSVCPPAGSIGGIVTVPFMTCAPPVPEAGADAGTHDAEASEDVGTPSDAGTIADGATSG
jgi:hypothetical protein